jgi:hypothetical protein
MIADPKNKAMNEKFRIRWYPVKIDETNSPRVELIARSVSEGVFSEIVALANATGCNFTQTMP